MKYIMGVGNYAMFDDSIGIRIIEHISNNKMEKDFQAIDISSNTLNLFSYLNEDTKKILVVDTMKSDRRPGEFLFFGPSRVESQKMLTGISSHESDLLKVIELAKEMNYHIPEIVLMGIVPDLIKHDFGISAVLEKNFNNYVNAAISEIRR